VLVVAGLVLSASLALAQCGDWELVSPHPHGRDLARVVFGGDRFVAVGYSVTQTSVDGMSWDVVAHDGVHLNAVAWDGAAYVAVGDGGVILRSTDGRSWEQVPSPTTADLRDVAWGGGEYVAVGGEGVAIRSTSGVVWQAVTLPTVQKLRGVTYGTGTFYVLGDSKTLLTGYGTSWRVIAVPSEVSPWTGSIVEVGGRLWVATYAKLYVYDGVTWTAPAGIPCLDHLVRQGEQFLAVACHGPTSIYSSADGFVWTAESGPDTWVQPRSVAVGGGRAVAVGAAGMQLARQEGQAWELVSGRVDGFRDVASNGQILVATALESAETGCVLLSSSDGREWTCRLSLGEQTDGKRVAWLGDRFVALVEDFRSGTRSTWSRDGVTWSGPQVVAPMNGLDVIRFRDRFLAFAGFNALFCPIGECVWEQTHVYASDDLASWHLAGVDPLSSGMVSVATNGSRIVAARCCDPDHYPSMDLKGFATSEDGETWADVSIPETLPATTKIVWTGSRFVATGGGVVMESVDGLAWSVIARSSRSLTGLAWTGSQLVGSGMWGSFPFVASSRDGREWSVTWPFLQPRSLAYPTWPVVFDRERPVSAVAGSATLQVAVGPQGVLLRRECVPEPVTGLRRRLSRHGAGSQP
jgi:hypothetical protein